VKKGGSPRAALQPLPLAEWSAQAAGSFFLRRRTAAAPAPNRNSIEGSGTSVPELLPCDELPHPYLQGGLPPVLPVEPLVEEDDELLEDVLLELEVLEVMLPEVELEVELDVLVETFPEVELEVLEETLPDEDVEVEDPPVEVEVELPVELLSMSMSMSIPPDELLEPLELPEVVVVVLTSTLPPLDPPKNPPTKPPKPPPKPPEPPITTGPPPPEPPIIGPGAGSGIETGTMAVWIAPPEKQ
jgi:hypothetical protein